MARLLRRSSPCREDQARSTEHDGRTTFGFEMTDGSDNLVVPLLCRLDRKVDRLIDDVQDLKHRMTALEIQVAGQSSRMDRIEIRLDRIERRLELAPAP